MSSFEAIKRVEPNVNYSADICWKLGQRFCEQEPYEESFCG